MNMTQSEAEQLVTDELGKKGSTDVKFNNVVMGENTIRVNASYKNNGVGESKELLVLRMGGRWRVLL